MVKTHGDKYLAYMNKTGMFLPRRIERSIYQAAPWKQTAFILSGTVIVPGSAFLLRDYTIDRLTLWTGAKIVAALAILPEDGFMMDHRTAGILSLREVKIRLHDNKHYLVYFLPRNYVMQGMIADTGDDWRRYLQHHSISLIKDWIFIHSGIRGKDTTRCTKRCMHTTRSNQVLRTVLTRG